MIVVIVVNIVIAIALIGVGLRVDSVKRRKQSARDEWNQRLLW